MTKTTATETTTLPTTTNLLEWALWYARNGWQVFPLKPRDKTPLTTNGFHDATADELQIRAWWEQHRDANIGVPVPDGLFVADVDVHGAQGDADKVALRRLQQLAPLETTVLARTGSGGYHIWLRVPDGVDVTGGDKNKFVTLEGVDKRRAGVNYLVVPPSLHACGTRYEWKQPPFITPLLDMPPHIIALAQAGKPSSSPVTVTVTGTGERRSQWAEDDAPIGEGERNNTLTRIAGILRAQGLDVDAIAIALHKTNERRCQPPLGADEVQAIAESVSRYQPGTVSEPREALAQVGGVAGVAGETNTRRAPQSLAALLTRQLPDVRWAVPDLIPQGATLLAGKPKVGKSWAALALAIAVGSGGRAFGQLKCERGHVLYLALEDTERRLQSRTLQLLGDEATGWAGDVEFALEWEPLDRGRDGGPTGYARLDSYLSEHPETRLVIVDTFAKIRPVEHAKGGYSYDDDYRAMGLLKRLADTHSVAFLIIHHTRKATSDDPQDIVSGTTGLTGAVDSTMVLTRARGENEAALFMTGRDIEERSLVLQRQDETGLWVLTQTAAEELGMPEKQRAVIAFLRAQPDAVEAQAIWQAVGGERDAVYKLLRRMVANGSLVKPGYGLFTLTARLRRDTSKNHPTPPTSPTHPTSPTSPTGAGGDGPRGVTGKLDGVDGQRDTPIQLSARNNSASTPQLDGLDGLDGYTMSSVQPTPAVPILPDKPPTARQVGWLRELGYTGDAEALTCGEASDILDGLLRAKDAAKDAAKDTAKHAAEKTSSAKVQKAQRAKKPVDDAIPAIPAGDAGCCIVCGEDVMPDSAYCADHQPQTVTAAEPNCWN